MPDRHTADGLVAKMNETWTIRHPTVWKTSLWGLLLAAGGFFLIDQAVNQFRFKYLPKNVAVVREGTLYRSGQLEPKHFESTIEQFHIRTVIQLNPHEGNQWEETIARKHGAELISVSMPGTGLGEAEDFDRVMKIVRDPARQPILVHCAAGANRTGMVSALFRMMEDHWVHEDAVREMQSRGFDGRVDLPQYLKDVHGRLAERQRGKDR